MSILSAQSDELREAARNIQGNLGRCLYRRKDVDEMQQVSGMLFEAANIIDSLRDRLQETQGACVGECEMDVLDTGNEAAYEHYEYIMHCANCHHEFGYVQYNEDGDTWMDEKPKHCPNCGRRVKGGAE